MAGDKERKAVSSNHDNGTTTTEPNPADYTAFERKLALAMNEEAYAPHEEGWAKDRWPVFLPHARAAS